MYATGTTRGSAGNAVRNSHPWARLEDTFGVFLPLSASRTISVTMVSLNRGRRKQAKLIALGPNYERFDHYEDETFVIEIAYSVEKSFM